jgi:hypothetical protein
MSLGDVIIKMNSWIGTCSNNNNNNKSKGGIRANLV